MASKKNSKSILSKDEKDRIIEILRDRFKNHMNRHKGIAWDQVQINLESSPEKLWSIHEMERSGGEPDVVGYDKKSGEFIFFDCSDETPKGRRSVCYDREGLDSRKEHKPKDSAIDMANAMGIDLLTEDEYKHLQSLGEFDTKTSSWIQTPPDIRKLGGAIFADCRYGHVFIYHNGAQSYYSVRAFRGSIRV
jgi:hypothetical protein